MFEQAKFKLHWAEQYLRELGEGITQFTAKEPCEVWSEYNTQTKVLLLKVVGQFAPVWPSLVAHAGVCAQIINSSLDYVTSELVNTARQTDRRVVFPMDVDLNKLAESKAIRTLSNLNQDLARFILDEIKPTKADNFPLWAVRSLANTDKHRNLLLAVHHQGFAVERVTMIDGTVISCRFWGEAGMEKNNEAVVAGVENYTDPKPLTQISFTEPDLVDPGIFRRTEAVEFLSTSLKAALKTINAIEIFLTP